VTENGEKEKRESENWRRVRRRQQSRKIEKQRSEVRSQRSEKQ
jgi:hypothetical protein